MKYGYTSSEACKIANISYRQLHHWDKTNLAKPSIAAASGTGSRRVYSFVDMVCLRVTARLKQEGISLQKIRKSITYLSENFPERDRPLADFVFLTDGDSVFVLTQNPDVLLDALKNGQFILSLPIGHIARDTKDRIINLEHEEESAGHIFEIVIEPDDDVYYAYCPALPGCMTWGHTKEKAFHYMQDAIELHLADMIADGEPVPGVGIVESIKPIIRIAEETHGVEQKATL